MENPICVFLIALFIMGCSKSREKPDVFIAAELFCRGYAQFPGCTEWMLAKVPVPAYRPGLFMGCFPDSSIISWRQGITNSGLKRKNNPGRIFIRLKNTDWS